ncbi:hypothetical protein ABZP36_007640 [Zizania latifolia]
MQLCDEKSMISHQSCKASMRATVLMLGRPAPFARIQSLLPDDGNPASPSTPLAPAPPQSHVEEEGEEAEQQGEATELASAASPPSPPSRPALWRELTAQR